MKFTSLLIEELLRALAIGWGVLMVLGLFYKSMGLSSEQVILFSTSMGLFSLILFTFIRRRTGASLKVATRRGWMATGVVMGIVILMFLIGSILLHNFTVNTVIGLVLAVFLIVITAWWGIRSGSNE